MSKQSLSAVPPDVAKPEVLKRFLSRLIEELDVVLGFRGTGKDKYVSQQELNSAAETLSSLTSGLAEATKRVGQLRKDLESLSIEATTLLQRIQTLENFAQNTYTLATTQTWLKMFELDFVGSPVNGTLVPVRSFNVDTLLRSAPGEYSVTFAINTFLGTPISDNTKVVVESRTAGTVCSVEYYWSGDTLHLFIGKHAVSGTDVVANGYDPIAVNDIIRVSGLIARPSAGVPA